MDREALWVRWCPWNEQLGAWHFGAYERSLACGIHAMHSKDVLCQIDSDSYDTHDFPFQVS